MDAWHATTLDIEEVPSGATVGHAHIFAAGVVKSFDAVDRGITDCALEPIRFTWLVEEDLLLVSCSCEAPL